MISSKTVDNAAKKLIGEMLADLSPEIFNYCQAAVLPLTTDLSLIPDIVKQVAFLEGEINTENICFAIAVLDRFYWPVQLIYPKLMKKPVGLRDKYAEVFGYDHPENISIWGDILIAYFKNHRYANRVHEVSSQIYQNLKTNGKITAEYPEIAPTAQPFENIKKDGKIVNSVISFIKMQNSAFSGVENALLF